MGIDWIDSVVDVIPFVFRCVLVVHRSQRQRGIVVESRGFVDLIDVIPILWMYLHLCELPRNVQTKDEGDCHGFRDIQSFLLGSGTVV